MSIRRGIRQLPKTRHTGVHCGGSDNSAFEKIERLIGMHGLNSNVLPPGYLQPILPITSLFLGYLSLRMWKTLKMMDGTIFRQMTRSSMLTLHQLPLIAEIPVAIGRGRGGALEGGVLGGVLGGVFKGTRLNELRTVVLASVEGHQDLQRSMSDFCSYW